MTSAGETCARCGAPSHDAYLCRTCTLTLRHTLHTIPDLHTDLTITHTRQDHLGTTRIGIITAHTDPGLPWADHASRAVEHLWTVLHTATRRLADQLADPTAPSGIDGMAGWLAEQVQLIRQQPDAAATLASIDGAVRRARRVIDLPPPSWYLGPCDECDTDLYCRPKAPIADCASCHARYDVPTRRDWLLRAAEDQLATAAEIARALPGLLDQPLSVGTIRSWASRGRLAAHGYWRDRPVYRVGDVVDLVTQEKRRAADRE